MFLFRLFGFFLLVYRSYLYVLNNNPSLHFATFSNLLSVCGSLFLFQYFGLIELLNFYCTWVYRFFFLYDFFSFLLLHLFKKASLILEHSRSSIYVCWITAAAGTERAGCLVQALQVLSWQCCHEDEGMGEITVEKRALQSSKGRSPGSSRSEVQKNGWAGGGNCECPAHRGNLKRATALPQGECAQWAEKTRMG